MQKFMAIRAETVELNPVQIEAYWSKVLVEDPSLCWSWRGARSSNGYGNVRVGRKYLKAHRVSYMLVSGPIPVGCEVCHTCDNPSCCNPHHLMLGTHRSNMVGMVVKARDPKTACVGSVNGNSKLSEKDVATIRLRYEKKEANQYELAELFGVSQTTIGSIVRGKTWSHVI